MIQDFLHRAKSRCVTLTELQLWNVPKHMSCFATPFRSPCKGHTLNNHNHSVRSYSRLMRSLIKMRRILCGHCIMLAIGFTCYFLVCWCNLGFELLSPIFANCLIPAIEPFFRLNNYPDSPGRSRLWLRTHKKKMSELWIGPGLCQASSVLHYWKLGSHLSDPKWLDSLYSPPHLASHLQSGKHLKSCMPSWSRWAFNT